MAAGTNTNCAPWLPPCEKCRASMTLEERVERLENAAAYRSGLLPNLAAYNQLSPSTNWFSDVRAAAYNTGLGEHASTASSGNFQTMSEARAELGLVDSPPERASSVVRLRKKLASLLEKTAVAIGGTK